MKAETFFISILLMIILVTLFIFIKVIKDEKAQCLSDPMVYGISKLDKQYNTSMSCTCSLNKGNYAPLVITGKGIQSLNRNIDRGFEVNLSGLEVLE